MTFPSNPNEDDLHEAFGRKLRYRSGKWQVVSSPSVATVTEEAPKTEAVAQAVDLPMSGNEIGAMAYVQESNRLYVWNGSGWFEVALVNTNPTITAGGNATYELATDGTPTVVTLTANDPEGIPLTWSYAVTSGSLGGTTVTNVDNVFTITPSTNEADAGTFQLTFTASDGVNVDTSVSSFSLVFGPVLMQTIDNPDPWNSGTQSDFFGRSINIYGTTRLIVGAGFEDDAGGTESGKAYVFDPTNGSLLYTLNNPNSYGTSYQDFFGNENCVAINSTRYWVSAYYNQASDGVTRAGTVYGFNLTGSLTNIINADNGIATFGKVIRASDDYLVIGAPDNYGPANQTGRAFIYDNSGSFLYTLTNPSIYSTTYDTFGFSVDVDGNYVIVSSPGSKKDASLAYLGRVYIYDATTGTLVKTLDNPNPETSSGFDQFGYVVRLSGNYAVVTSYSEDVGFTNSGIAYVYKTTNGTWSDATLLYTIYNPTASNPTTENSFGQNMDVNSDTIFITTGTKTLWAFNLIDGSPKYDLKLPNDTGIHSISATDTHIAMGSITSGSTPGKGQAFIYEL